MRRLLLVATAVFLPTFAVVLIAVSAPQTSQPGLPDQVRLVIDAYLEYHSQPTQTIRQVIPAARPWNFTSQMGRSWWAPATITPDDRNPAAMSTLVASWRFGSVGDKPLPFPPVAAWCVLLQPTDNASPRLVYVAKHEADYSMAWVVHAPTLDQAPDLSADLASVGCDADKTP